MDYNKFLFFINLYGELPLPYVGNIKIGLIYNIIFVFGLLFMFLLYQKNQKYYKNGFLRKSTVYLIGGKMGRGKTRFLTKISQEIKSQNRNTIICANYMNSNGDVFFSSREDFILLQKDIQLLGLSLNFTKEDKIEIEKNFLGYFNFTEEQEKFKHKLSKIKKLLPNLDILTLGDEFHLYLHSRQSMSNFNGMDGKKLLEMLHQTRHSNQLLLLSSQDTDTLDLDLRQIADKEIEVKEWLFGIFYGFNLYHYLNLKYQNIKDNLFFHKINKLPFIFFNGYLFYNLIESLNNSFEKIQKLNNRIINKIFKKNLYKTYRFGNYFKNQKLPYNTKFNVNISLSVYKEGKIFDIILEKFKEK